MNYELDQVPERTSTDVRTYVRTDVQTEFTATSLGWGSLRLAPNNGCGLRCALKEAVEKLQDCCVQKVLLSRPTG